MKSITVKSKDTGTRLDIFLTDKLDIPRSQIQKLIKSGAVLVNGKTPTPHKFLKADDKITVDKNIAPISKSPTTNPQPPASNASHPPATLSVALRAGSDAGGPTTNLLPDFKLEIVKETPDYLVVNKPSGVPVHPDSKYLTGSLIQKIVKKYPEIKKVGNQKIRPGIVHRLDKDASGLMVVARNQKMLEHLKKQFSDRQVKKQYLALVRGKLEKDSGVINFAIARSSAGTMAARPTNQEGKKAITEYKVIKRFINYTLVQVTIKTGRTHQIRVHFKALGHPLSGDKLYTVKKQKAETTTPPRLFLHSELLGFYDLNNEWQQFSSDLPQDLNNYLTKIK